MRLIRGIVLGGAIAGAIDITYAITFAVLRGRTAEWLLQLVASGLLGSRAYEGGMRTAALGLLLHFLIALIWSAIFVGASRAIPMLAARPYITGPIYGLLVYGLMNLVVLPLSAYPYPVAFKALSLTTGLFIHMFGIGLPIALCARSVGRASTASRP